MQATIIMRSLCDELKFCETKRDVDRVFGWAQRDFQERNVPQYRRQQVLKDLYGELDHYFDGPEREELISEAKATIRSLLLANS